ncbi:transcriptional regulator [Streptomyces sp. NPDC051001]|uniref:tetratricopeptide repeat protein n=1 Tax=Streptomyces sp. NPDC051001 TaxID=3155795 RepID=UPI0034123A30
MGAAGGDRVAGLGVPVEELTDPFALEVHRAIDAPDSAGAAELPVLPAYVERAHDRFLRAALDRAVRGASAMVTLVGGSSTGKTRACWEAVQRLPHGWRLWHPIAPTRPDALLADINAVTQRTVVWLNEAQFYLLDPGPRNGERIAAALRTLVADVRRGPVLVLATLWPNHWDVLTRQPAALHDPYAQQRALLTGVGTHQTVPGSFAGDDLQALRKLTERDPRLAHAVRYAADGEITQFLAGAPELLARHRNAEPPARALIEAAMDYRRLGLGPALSYNLLADAAEGYLNDREYDALTDDWLEQALTYCAQPCRGARGALTLIKARRGDTAPARPAYRLADFLEQHGRDARRFICPPASFWESAAQHASSADDKAALADAARQRWRDRYAARLYQQAADAGDTLALNELVRLLEEAGNRDGAERLAHRATDAGDTSVLEALYVARLEAGDHDGAKPLLRTAAEAGDTVALDALAWMLENSGDIAGAERLYRMLADAGSPSALQTLAWMLEDSGDSAGAERALRLLADAGDTDALRDLARLRARAGDRDGAESFSRTAAEAGNTSALRDLARLLERAGDREGAEHTYQAAADAGDTDAVHELVQLLEEAGDRDGAERLATDVGSSQVWWLAHLRKEAGDTAGAERLFQTLADTGTTSALSALAELLEEAGDRHGAERLARQATDAGEIFALRNLAGLREKSGDTASAEHLYQLAVGAGDTHALHDLARLRKEAGDTAGAERLLQTLADTGATSALSALAELLEEAGDRHGAERLARQATDAGEAEALKNLAQLRAEAGEPEWAQALRYGLAADGSISKAW